MKVLSAEQTRALDAYTIEHEPIRSIDLMERASIAFVRWFVKNIASSDRSVYVFCGMGNNGGDGLAIARLLSEQGYSIKVFICQVSSKGSVDFEKNKTRLLESTEVVLSTIQAADPYPELAAHSVIIDALLGAGLNRPLEGYWAELVNYLNQLNNIQKIAVDVPSGMFMDRHTAGISIAADQTLSFELPKLAFFLPENFKRVGDWQLLPIGLHPRGLARAEASYFFINPKLVASLYQERSKFDHKGTYGHALLMVGSYGMMGAAVLASRACMRSGTGLLSVAIPKCGYEILQTTLPEALLKTDESDEVLTTLPHLQDYSVVGIGCGIGKNLATRQLLLELLEYSDIPLVIDADALNIIAEESWQWAIPPGAVLTPHPKEFERLFGKADDDFHRLDILKAKAEELNSYIILKGAHTAIASPDGSLCFNSTGNPGMGTAGSGDVLTGILTGLLAQEYNTLSACILAVYLHGLAGDLAAKDIGQDALIASDIIHCLGKAFLEISQHKK